MLIPFSECIKFYGKPFGGVIHIGAHIGEEAKDYQANGVKEILWIEANKLLMKDLYDNTKYVPVKQQYLCEALSDLDGEKVTFRVTNNGQSSSILPLGTHAQHYPQIHVVENREVTTTRFDTLYRRHIAEIALENMDFLNLDIQGAELKALKGFGNLFVSYPNIKAIYTEVNFEEVYVGAPIMSELDSYLDQFGFKRIAHVTTPYGWGDALYLRK